MKAILQTQYSFKYEDALVESTEVPVPLPSKEKGQVLVKILYASMNPADYRMLEGAAAKFIKLEFPRPIGIDFCGVVHGFPAGVDPAAEYLGWRIGDIVCGCNEAGDKNVTGTLAEYALCVAKDLCAVPKGFPLAEAAGLPTISQTAYQIMEKLGLTPNQVATTPSSIKKFLVIGGSTAIGLLCLSLAKAVGCQEIVCTSTQTELCTSFGATEVINYRTQNWVETLRGRNFDAVLDCVEGYSAWRGAQVVLKPSGASFATIVIDDPSMKVITYKFVCGMVCSLINRNFWSLFGYPNYKNLPNNSNSPDRGMKYFVNLRHKTLQCSLEPPVTRASSVAEEPLEGSNAPVQLPSILDQTLPLFSFTVSDAIVMLERQRNGRCHGKQVMQIATPELVEEVASAQ
jgi:NADPH:quinone reductase-like Zn-dependent oxidoreductase